LAQPIAPLIEELSQATDTSADERGWVVGLGRRLFDIRD
jgi:hypothetical protein